MTDSSLRFWRAASLLFGAVALLKGLRRPGLWALSQLQISYEGGFVKRGLLGQLLYGVHLRAAPAVTAFCFLELALLVVVVAVFTWTSGLLSRTGFPALVTAFAGSYAVTFLAHLIGYQEIALYTLAIAAVLFADPRRRFLAALPVCVVGPLIHELFLFSALPILLFSFLAQPLSVTRNAARWYAASLLIVTGAVTLCATTSGTLSSDQLRPFQQQTQARARYPIDPRVLGVVDVSTAENFRTNLNVIRNNWWWWAELLVGLLVVGPLLALIFFTARGLVPGGGWVLFVCLSLTPLLLNLLAWDNVRWISLCALTAYSNFGLLVRSAQPSRPHGGRAWEERSAIIVLGLGLASGYGLMDARKVNPYPFFPPAIRPAVIRHDGVFGRVL